VFENLPAIERKSRKDNSCITRITPVSVSRVQVVRFDKQLAVCSAQNLKPRRLYVHPQCWYLSTKLHAVTTQETVCTFETLVLIHQIINSHVPRDSMYTRNIGTYPPNHTQSRPKRQHVHPKHWYLSTKSHTVTSQETVCTSEILVLFHQITGSHIPRDSMYTRNIGTYPPNHKQYRPKRQYVHPKHWYLSTKSHIVTSQETVCTSEILVLFHKITGSHVPRDSMYIRKIDTFPSNHRQ
jgi:ribosomal protein S16